MKHPFLDPPRPGMTPGWVIQYKYPTYLFSIAWGVFYHIFQFPGGILADMAAYHRGSFWPKNGHFWTSPDLEWHLERGRMASNHHPICISKLVHFEPKRNITVNILGQLCLWQWYSLCIIWQHLSHIYVKTRLFAFFFNKFFQSSWIEIFSRFPEIFCLNKHLSATFQNFSVQRQIGAGKGRRQDKLINPTFEKVQLLGNSWPEYAGNSKITRLVFVSSLPKYVIN